MEADMQMNLRIAHSCYTVLHSSNDSDVQMYKFRSQKQFGRSTAPGLVSHSTNRAIRQDYSQASFGSWWRYH